MPKVLIKRGTRAQLETAKGASQLAQGEPYFITDENRLAIGTAGNGYQPLIKEILWQMVISPLGSNVSTGYKGGAAAGMAGTITSVIVDCNANNKPTLDIVVDLYKVDRSTGARTSVLSTQATLSAGTTQGAGAVNASQAAVTADTFLEPRIVQGSDGQNLTIRVLILTT